MSDAQRIDYHLLRIRRLVALIEHENLMAAREQSLGHWLSDHTEAVTQLDKELDDEQKALQHILTTL